MCYLDNKLKLKVYHVITQVSFSLISVTLLKVMKMSLLALFVVGRAGGRARRDFYGTLTSALL